MFGKLTGHVILVTSPSCWGRAHVVVLMLTKYSSRYPSSYPVYFYIVNYDMIYIVKTVSCYLVRFLFKFSGNNFIGEHSLHAWDCVAREFRLYYMDPVKISKSIYSLNSRARGCGQCGTWCNTIMHINVSVVWCGVVWCGMSVYARIQGGWTPTPTPALLA